MYPFLYPLALLVCLLFSLLVCLSVPISHTLYLWKLDIDAEILDTGVTGDIKFGLWGYCANITESIVSFTVDESTTCHRSFGIHVDNILTKLFHIDAAEKIINNGLEAVLILHPITPVFIFISLLTYFFVNVPVCAGPSGRSPIRASTASLVSTILAAIIGTVNFGLDWALINSGKQFLEDSVGSMLDISRGNALWLSLALTIILWTICVPAAFAYYKRQNRLKQGAHWSEKY